MRETAGTEIVMGISVGMLIFGLFDGGLAFAIVFCLLKARFKGKKNRKNSGDGFRDHFIFYLHRPVCLF